MGDTKICTKCGVEKPATMEYFYTDKYRQYGLCSACKECKIKQYQANKETILQKRKKRYEENKERVLEQCKQHYKDCKEVKQQYYVANKGQITERRKNHYIVYKDDYAQKNKQYYEENKERCLASSKLYQGANNERLQELGRRWRQLNSDKVKVYGHRYRSIKRSLPATFTAEQWRAAIQYFNGNCCYCGKNSALEQDHFIPISRFGPYTKNNIVPACTSCNCSKRDKDFFEWYPKQRFYSKRRECSIVKYLTQDYCGKQIKTFEINTTTNNNNTGEIECLTY